MCESAYLLRMKIRLAPSGSQDGLTFGETFPVVEVEVPQNDLQLEEVVTLFRGALSAFGFVSTEKIRVEK